MAYEPGLPTVPRGLPSNLTSYLRDVDVALRRLTGQSRGDSGAQAVRRSEAGTLKVAPSMSSSVSTGMIHDASVTTGKLADRAVTKDKIDDWAVTTKKIADEAVGGAQIASSAITTEKLCDSAVTGNKIAKEVVEEKHIKHGAVTKDKIAIGAVTAEHMEDGVLPIVPSLVSGTANDAEEVFISGLWSSQPLIVMTSFTVAEQPFTVGATDIIEVSPGKWRFIASGDFTWSAIGYEKQP